MEGSERKLRPGLANGLRGNNANGRTQLNHITTGQVKAIALGADTLTQFAGHGRVNIDIVAPGGVHSFGYLLCEQLAGVNENLAGFRISHRLGSKATIDSLSQCLFTEVVAPAHVNALDSSAVLSRHNDILGHVY